MLFPFGVAQREIHDHLACPKEAERSRYLYLQSKQLFWKLSNVFPRLSSEFSHCSILMMGGLFHKDNYNGLVGGISGGGGIGFLYKHLCPGVNLHVLGAGLKEQLM